MNDNFGQAALTMFASDIDTAYPHKWVDANPIIAGIHHGLNAQNCDWGASRAYP